MGMQVVDNVPSCAKILAHILFIEYILYMREEIRVARVRVWLHRGQYEQAHAAAHACALRWNELSEWLRSEWDSGRIPAKRDLRAYGDSLGLVGVHSHTRQGIADDLWEAIKSSRSKRRNGGKARAPRHQKKYRPLAFSTQAWRVRDSKLVLPFGTGAKDIVIPAPRFYDSASGELVQPEHWREMQLCWDVRERAWFLMIPYATIRNPLEAATEENPGIIVSVDEGIINSMTLATLTPDGVEALVLNGRGIRSFKQERNKRVALLRSMQSRCQKHSRRYQRVGNAIKRCEARTERRLRNVDHNVAAKANAWIRDKAIDKTTGEVRPVRLVVGDVRGIEKNTQKKRRASRSTRQQLSQWSRGRQEKYLSEKTGLSLEHINEAYTSQTCPACGTRRKVAGRSYACKNPECGLVMHRDVVGAMNILTRATSGGGDLSPCIGSDTTSVVKYQRAVPLGRRAVVASNQATSLRVGVAENRARVVSDSPRCRLIASPSETQRPLMLT